MSNEENNEEEKPKNMGEKFLLIFNIKIDEKIDIDLVAKKIYYYNFETLSCLFFCELVLLFFGHQALYGYISLIILWLLSLWYYKKKSLFASILYSLLLIFLIFGAIYLLLYERNTYKFWATDYMEMTTLILYSTSAYKMIKSCIINKKQNNL